MERENLLGLYYSRIEAATGAVGLTYDRISSPVVFELLSLPAVEMKLGYIIKDVLSH